MAINPALQKAREAFKRREQEREASRRIQDKPQSFVGKLGPGQHYAVYPEDIEKYGSVEAAIEQKYVRTREGGYTQEARDISRRYGVSVEQAQADIDAATPARITVGEGGLPLDEYHPYGGSRYERVVSVAAAKQRLRIEGVGVKWTPEGKAVGGGRYVTEEKVFGGVVVTPQGEGVSMMNPPFMTYQPTKWSPPVFSTDELMSTAGVGMLVGGGPFAPSGWAMAGYGALSYAAEFGAESYLPEKTKVKEVPRAAIDLPLMAPFKAVEMLGSREAVWPTLFNLPVVKKSDWPDAPIELRRVPVVGFGLQGFKEYLGPVYEGLSTRGALRTSEVWGLGVFMGGPSVGRAVSGKAVGFKGSAPREVKFVSKGARETAYHELGIIESDVKGTMFVKSQGRTSVYKTYAGATYRPQAQTIDGVVSGNLVGEIKDAGLKNWVKRELEGSPPKRFREPVAGRYSQNIEQELLPGGVVSRDLTFTEYTYPKTQKAASRGGSVYVEKPEGYSFASIGRGQLGVDLLEPKVVSKSIVYGERKVVVEPQAFKGGFRPAPYYDFTEKTGAKYLPKPSEAVKVKEPDWVPVKSDLSVKSGALKTRQISGGLEELDYGFVGQAYSQSLKSSGWERLVLRGSAAASSLRGNTRQMGRVNLFSSQQSVSVLSKPKLDVLPKQDMFFKSLLASKPNRALIQENIQRVGLNIAPKQRTETLTQTRTREKLWSPPTPVINRPYNPNTPLPAFMPVIPGFRWGGERGGVRGKRVKRRRSLGMVGDPYYRNVGRIISGGKRERASKRKIKGFLGWERLLK